MAAQYTGRMPIPEEFLKSHRRRRVITEIEVPLDEIIWANGFEEMDIIASEILGAELEDMFYTAQRVNQGRIVLQVTGVA